MKIEYVGLDEDVQKADMVVVIDTCRAFTTSAHAFALGAKELFPVQTIEDAFELQKQFSEVFLMGEENGMPIEGFDLWNSPAQLHDLNLNLDNKSIIQRTSCGTQGLVKYKGSKNLVAGSFCCSRSIAEYIRTQNPKHVLFVITGKTSGINGDEDLATAEYIVSILNGKEKEAESFEKRIRTWLLEKWEENDPESYEKLKKDLEYCAVADQFNFVMPVSMNGKHLVMTKVVT